jgi:hypothetical protein
MRQKSGFDRYPEFKSKRIEFEVGDKYLFRQLTDLLIRRQACSSNPLAKKYHENKLKRPSRRFEDVKKSKKRSSQRFEIQPESAILVESQGLLTRV